jgi:hypothetical protein
MKRTNPLLPRILFLSLLSAGSCWSAETLFVEAESLAQHGGWSLDTSFTSIVGSPYLLAHGLGKPVADAQGTLRISEGGSYRIWVRTKDWVAPWKAPGTPGRFQVLVNGKPLATEFGTEGAEWHWQAGGTVDLSAGEASLALHDLTGFDGRCDALVLSNDAKFIPPEGGALTEDRRKRFNPDGPENAGEFDLVVVGGGYAGLGAAISASRQSLRVALIQDRFVLGGNGSSEIGVWAQGGTMRGKYPHIGEIVEEFTDRSPDSPAPAEHFEDAKKEAVCRAEKTLSLFLGHYVYGVVQDAPGKPIRAVVALDVRTGRERRFTGKFFADCTGHATVGGLAGADFEMEKTGHMGMSNMWYWQHADGERPWPETPWALPLVDGDFPSLPKSRSQLDGKFFFKGEWFWESGFSKHPLDELELTRDWNLRAVFGAFSVVKRGAKAAENADAELKWVSHVGGPRESRRLIGDVVLTQENIVEKKDFNDGFVPTTWDIDLHYPREQYAAKFPDNPFISRAQFGRHVDRKNGYPVPYRCFYSRNIGNLFMAGRNISVTHEALGTVRVMRTCGMMGEIVGKAAYLAVRHGVSPRGVYEKHLPELISLAEQPGAMRRDSLAGELRRDPGIQIPLPKPAESTVAVTPELARTFIAADESDHKLQGLVVDDSAAHFTGNWPSTKLRPHVGVGARYASQGAGSEARFDFKVETAGKYEVRVFWSAHDNRASKAGCVLERSGQPPQSFKINQRVALPPGGFSLGVFDFAASVTHSLRLTTAGADGNVVADAIQILPVR